ncbi:hypothetical protein BC835DRAFT_1306252 [Cytidiella melzeri]|nr:hypothetical protein BC835DRAFT_1306252 [Cytidiella melzeri]
MDDLINADTRKDVNCRRKPITIYFSGGKNAEQTSVSDHLLCDTTREHGCSRCAIKTPRLCCDLHGAKALIDALHPPTTVERLPGDSKRSRLKTYTTAPADMELKESLHQWRTAKTIEKYGHGGLADFGPGVVIPDAMLARIVDCAHHGKIESTEDLVRETKWAGVEVYGDEVLQLIRQVHPPARPPAFTTVELRDSRTSDSTPEVTALAPKAQRKCGACRQTGHTRKSLSL